MQQIPFLDLKPQINTLWEEINHAIQEVLHSGAFILGPEVSTFESEVAELLGCRYAIGVNSGTDALTIGLRALGVGPGDEVITSPFSFFATAESISLLGAKPVFVDVNPDTFNIDVGKIEQAITPKTKVIMPVHLYGQPADMSPILNLAKAYKLQVLEDCAQSIGAQFFPVDSSPKYTGNIGDVGAFSFYPTKNLGAFGDGGLITTNHANIAEAASMLRNHGAKKRYHNEYLGYNSRLDSIQAAILRVKLRHLHKWNQERRQAAEQYNRLLEDIEDVITPKISKGHIFHQYTIKLVKADRDRVKEDLAKAGVSTMVYYPLPQDKLPVYKGGYPEYPHSNALSQQVLSLPLWPEISLSVQEKIIRCLREALK